MNLDANLLAAGLALLLVCIAYDHVIAHLERTGYDRGFTALFVVAGVALVLAAYAAVDGIWAALRAGLLFAAAGIPMTVGSVVRYNRARAADERAARDLAMARLQEHTL